MEGFNLLLYCILIFPMCILWIDPFIKCWLFGQISAPNCYIFRMQSSRYVGLHCTHFQVIKVWAYSRPCPSAPVFFVFQFMFLREWNANTLGTVALALDSAVGYIVQVWTTVLIKVQSKDISGRYQINYRI